MRTILADLSAGLGGWARVDKPGNETIRMTDAALTVTGTLLVALTWFMLHG